MKKYIYLFIIFSMGLKLYPQQIPNNSQSPKVSSIVGVVLDSQDKTPVEYASVTLVSVRSGKTVSGTLTDEKGRFTLKNLPYGQFKVEVSFVGYSKFSKADIHLTENQKSVNIGEILLKADITSLDEVVITAEMTTIENRIDKKVVNVGKDLLAAGSSALEVFQNVPMIEVDMDNNISLRGSDNVRVLVDGRPSNMSAADLLESMPAESIEKIELITNPSAKNDPDGESGIINIITKKENRVGFALAARVGVDTRNRYNGGFDLSVYRGKVLFYTNYNFRFNQMDRFSKTYRGNFMENRQYLNYQNSDTDNNMQSHRLKIGLDYMPTKKTMLSFAVSYSPNIRKSNGISDSYFIDLDINRDDFTKDFALSLVESNSADMESLLNRHRENKTRTESHNITGSVNITHQFDANKKLEFDTNLEYNTSKADGNFINLNRVGEELVQSNESSYSGTNNIMSNTKLDYSQTINKNSSFETGFSANILDRDMPYFYYIEGAPDMSRSNHFSYKQQIYSLYGTYSYRFKMFSFKPGLRIEETLLKSTGLGLVSDNGNLVLDSSKDKTYNNNYFAIYPSIHISYEINPKNELSVNYSRRVSRPSSRQLNPTPMFSDPLYVNVGNPYLDPSFTNSVELGYSLKYPLGNIGVSGFYRNSTDMIQRVTTRQDPTDPTASESEVLYTTFYNKGSMFTIGSNYFMTLKAFSWWNINLSMNLYYNERNIPDQTNYVKNNVDFSSRMNNSFNLWKGARAQLSLMYSAPRATLQGRTSSRYGMDIGINQSFLKNKLTVGLRLRDALNSMRMDSSTYGDDFILFSDNKHSFRTLNLNIRYTFSEIKYDDKFKKRRAENNSEEDSSITPEL